VSFLFQKNISKPSSSESKFAKPLISNHSSCLYDHQTDEFVQNKSIENNPGFSFQNISIQPKLKVSQSGDPYEKEADRVADQIMRMSISSEDKIAISDNEKPSNKIQKKCTACKTNKKMEEEELKIHRKSQPSSGLKTSDEISNQITNAGVGRPLDNPTKSFMNSRFRYDFSDVRIHDDSKANQLTGSVNARAFTYGNEIFMGKNESTSDKKLMAHELTHVVQNQKYIQRVPCRPGLVYDPIVEDCVPEGSQASGPPPPGESYEYSGPQPSESYTPPAPEESYEEYVPPAPEAPRCTRTISRDHSACMREANFRKENCQYRGILVCGATAARLGGNAATACAAAYAVTCNQTYYNDESFCYRKRNCLLNGVGSRKRPSDCGGWWSGWSRGGTGDPWPSFGRSDCYADWT